MPRITKNMDTQKTKDGEITFSYLMLAKNNYTTWSISMKIFLQAEGVWEAIDSKDTKVVIEDKKDKMAMEAIY